MLGILVSALVGFRRESAHPFHPMAPVVQKRVLAKGSFYRIGPRHRPGARPLLLSQERKDGCRGLP